MNREVNGPAPPPLQSAEYPHEVPSSVQTGRLTEDLDTLQRDGIVANKAVFSRDGVERLREAMMTAFGEAIQRPGSAVNRGRGSARQEGTQAWGDALPPVVRRHLVCRVVDTLTPITEEHDIEGFVMG